MAETFDHAMHEEQAAELEDREEKQIAERLEDERRELQAFADWMEGYSGESAVAKTAYGESFLQIVYGGTVYLRQGSLICASKGFQTPYKALWAIYQKETSKQ